MVLAYEIIVSGIVQGVGFRPYIYRCAVKSRVRGYVKNLGGGDVLIYIEGGGDEVSKFMSCLFQERPPPAVIENLVMREARVRGVEGFSIERSSVESIIASQIPPDFSICDHCVKELDNPSDRRYRYPFNSCAYCGPRYSMIYRMPYDRDNTSMKAFPLCSDCLSEYRDVWNVRRFEAQGISCPKCGPKLVLREASTWEALDGDPINLASKLISEGRIVAIKGIGGFHIAVDPFNDDAILKLRSRKARPQKPFALMAISVDVVEKYAYIEHPLERLLLASPERPIVLLRKKEDSEISRYVSPGLDREGFMLYYTGIHYLILKELPKGVSIMTSGNPKGLPMCRDDECVKTRLRGVVDYVLTHNREIVNRVDDSVVRLTAGRPVIIRRGRGYAPRWIRLPYRLNRPVIAFGAELQNAGAVAFDDKVILTPYIGDTDNLETLEDLRRSIEMLLSTYSIDPSKALIVADKHPRYSSRILAERFASKYGARIAYIQHHFAHALSCAADNGLEEGVAIAIDGVGYGDDGNIWGGEVISFDRRGYKRRYHLKYFPMPGGDLASIYPARMLVGVLSRILSDENSITEILRSRGLTKYFRSEEELEISIHQARRTSLLTSSTGRVLDAVSVFLGVCGLRTYEGEPAIKLEAAARGGRLLEDLEIPVYGEEIDTSYIFKWLLEADGRRIEDLAYTIQYKLGEALAKAALKAGASDKILVSGGAAVNEYIVRGIISGAEGLEVILPKRVPPGDGGIALGQAIYAFE